MTRFTKHGMDGDWKEIPPFKTTMQILEDMALREMGEKGYFFIRDKKAFNNIKKMLMNAYYKQVPITLVHYTTYLKKRDRFRKS